MLLASGSRRSAVIDERRGAVYIHVESCLHALEKAGHVYDVTTPRVLTHLVVERGLGVATRHRFGKQQLRAVKVLPSTLAGLSKE